MVFGSLCSPLFLVKNLEASKLCAKLIAYAALHPVIVTLSLYTEFHAILLNLVPVKD